MPDLKLWALVDLSDNTVLSVFKSLEDALFEYRFLNSGLFCSFDLGIFLFCPQGICPLTDDAAKTVKDN